MDTPRSRWSVVAAFSLVGAATQMVWLTFAAGTSVAADHYDVSVTAIGWLSIVFVLCFVILAIPAGILLDRFLRPALLLGAVLTAAGAVLRCVGDDYTWALTGGVVAALGQPIMLTGIAGLTHHYLAPRDRATGIALATASTWAGFIAAFGLGAVFADADDMRTLLIVHAAYAVVAAVVLALALRTRAPFEQHPQYSRVSEDLRAVGRAWSDPLIRLLCMIAFIPFGTTIALTTWTEALLEPAGVSVEAVGVILIVNIVAGVVGTATIPIWAAKRRKEALAGVVAVTVTVASCLLLAIAPGSGTALVSMAFTGFLLLPMLAVVLELIERHADEGEGVASGLVWATGNLGGLVVSGLVGFTVDSPALSFVMLAVITAGALPLLARLFAPVAALAPIDGLDDEARPSATGRDRERGTDHDASKG